MRNRTGPTFYNELTTPDSSSLRFVPRNTADGQNLAADIHPSQPFSPEAVESILHAKDAMPHITKLVISPLNNPVSFPDNPLHCPSTG